MVKNKSHLPETHRSSRIGWLRASVLGANDGIVSTASLILGVAASRSDKHEILIAGIAGLVAGAMSMAAGEYVSVSSQSDTEKSDLDREKVELENDLEFEKKELAEIYVRRGLDPELAKKVADQLMQHDAIGAHARDELGITQELRARPIQAAASSAAAFALGASFPLLVVWIVPASWILSAISLTSIAALVFLGAASALTGGSRILAAVARVTFWGIFAMALTTLIGRLLGKIIDPSLL